MIFKIFWGHILWCNYYLNYIYHIKYIIYMFFSGDMDLYSLCEGRNYEDKNISKLGL